MGYGLYNVSRDKFVIQDPYREEWWKLEESGENDRQSKVFPQGY